ncbi:MAG TPA: S41 family peptidase [Thermoanaerobaculia bacterium]|nr:S41 family peptidase [Thermoanaerobaculia bacterium]
MHRKLVPAALVLAFLFALGPPLAAENAAAPAPQSSIERLTHVGKLWGMVRYLHPYIAYKEIDWDAALVAAVPEIREAKTREEYRAAVEGMLAALGDPDTKVMDVPAQPSSTPMSRPGPPEKKPQAPPVVRRLKDGVVAFDLGPYLSAASPRELGPHYQALRQEIGQARAVVVDLRSSDKAGSYGYAIPGVLEQSASFLAGRRCQGPGERYLMHSGYRPQFGSLTGGYYSGFLTLASNAYGPAPGTAESPKRVVFLVDQGNRSLPNIVSALQACGDGRVVSVGKLAAQSPAETRSFPLGEGLMANVRVSEVLPLPGWNGLAADVELPEGTSPEAAYQAALAEARRPIQDTPRDASAFTPLPDFVLRLDKTYPEMVEPDLPHRQLAVIRAWNVIHHFYPYLHLLDDWEAVLPEFLTRMETAATGRDYAQALLEMMTRVADSHTGVWGHPEMSKDLGNGWLPLEVRWIEEAAVVRAVGEEARPSGILPGDAILAVDGEATAALIERRSRTMPASTPSGRLARICREILRGPAGSTAVLSVQSPGGTPREVRLQRDPRHGAFFPPSEGETVRILPGNLGYADLTRLTIPEVDAMFEKVKDTRALIFDMRGYPHSTAGEIAARINTRKARIGAQFRRSQVSAFSTEETASGYYFSQPLTEDPRGLPLYTRPTVMLIDDQAISAAEHTGLFLEAANGTRFIGTPTAGANGDITRFTLPGGVNVMFTGHDVRHADGRQLQRVGLIPEVEVAPTRQGLHDGRDEVLERAVRFLEEELGGGK